MQFNITTDYAIRNEITTSKEIAEAMGITLYYLFKITSKLVKVKIVQRFQGTEGGFKLQNAANEREKIV